MAGLIDWAMSEPVAVVTIPGTPDSSLSLNGRAPWRVRKVTKYTGLGENVYTRAAGGRRADLNDRYFRSSWEANYARYLNWLIENRQIAGWEYEVDVFVFEGYSRGAIAYRPDFKVTELDGSVIYHEVKGWMDGPSKTRLKRMAKHYPDVKIVVIGPEEYKAVAKWKGLIPEWESGRHE